MAPRTNGAGTGDGAGSGAGRAGSGAGAADATVEGRNLWDFLSVAVVVAGLVGLTIFLVANLHKEPENHDLDHWDRCPALAAVFGVTVGYAGGNLKRQATGKKAAKQQLSSKVQELLTVPRLHPPMVPVIREQQRGTTEQQSLFSRATKLRKDRQTSERGFNAYRGTLTHSETGSRSNLNGCGCASPPLCLALGHPDRCCDHPPASPRPRLTRLAPAPTAKKGDPRARGTPHTRRDNRATAHGRRAQLATSHHLRRRHQDHERSRLELQCISKNPRPGDQISQTTARCFL